MMNEIITSAINDSFYRLCTDNVIMKDINYGAITEAITIAFELRVITADELRYLLNASREIY